VVGGSGLYHRALVQGLAPVPSVPPSVRAELVARLESEGRDSLMRELFSVDPETGRGFGVGDTQRLLRALEVFHGTGVPLSSWWQRRSSDEEPISALSIGLTVPRTILYHRIGWRTAAMFATGWVEEVRSLLARGYTSDQPAFQAIGYRQIVAHLRGAGPLEQAVEETLIATRQFAKRQLTWFRKDAGVEWFDAQDPTILKSQVREFLRTNCVCGGVDA
jgi:tRNA dimethylallyltransferase